MSKRIKIETLKKKIEFMIDALDGPPDRDELENKTLLQGLEDTSNSIKADLTECKNLLVQRIERDDREWYQSKERILLDEDLKSTFESAEKKLAHLRTIFKQYQKKNKLLLPETEIKARTRNIDLLRQQINLLRDEFRTQTERHRIEKAVDQGHVTQVYKKRQRGVQKEFIDIFGSQSKEGEGKDENDVPGEEMRDLDQHEREILKAFEANDKELDAVAAKIVEELEKVKNNAQNIEGQIDKQGELLKRTNARADGTHADLQMQSSDLKDAINKHKNGKQCCFDMTLLIVVLGLMFINLKLLQGKGYL